MSVTATFTPPAQPGTGVLTYVPLGGDGYTAPQAAYAINNFEVIGDASAGHARLTVEMDPRFCSLVAWVSFSIRQATSADAEYRLTVGSTSGATQIPTQADSGLVVAISSTITTAEINKMISIVPMMMPGAGQSGRVEANFLNVDTDTYRMSLLIYLFNIRVRELTPMGPLLWARGST